MVTGAALGVPGTARVFDETTIGRILGGEQFIGEIPAPLQAEILGKHITRLVKRADADPVFETIESPDEVVKLAAGPARSTSSTSSESSPTGPLRSTS